MRLVVALCFLAAVNTLTSGCRKSKDLSNTDYMSFAPAVSAKEALMYFQDLKDLSGSTTNEPSAGFLFYASYFPKQVKTIEYPQTHFFFTQKKDDAECYYTYAVRKETQTAPWQLVRAWVADKNGKELRVLKESGDK